MLIDDRLRRVALLKLAGHTNEETAQLCGRSVTTIERCLRMIRLAWSEACDEASDVASAPAEKP